MKKLISKLALAVSILFSANFSSAQTTGMDFFRTDCNGNMQHLFADLDSGNAVILEFFMLSCAPCVVAGNALEPLKSTLLTEFPGKIKSYAIGFSNTYTCSSINSWVTTNAFTSVPMDSGGLQVAYYGGMGMPTVVVLCGASHAILGSPYMGFIDSDTTSVGTNIRNCLNPAAVNNISSTISSFNVYPNPTSNLINLSFNLNEASNVSIEVTDVTGRKVDLLMNEKVSSGNFSKSYNTTNLKNGYYLIRVNANGITTNYKLNIAH